MARVTWMAGLVAMAGMVAMGASAALPSAAAAQDDLLVLIVDPGPSRVNQASLSRAIGSSTERTVIRLTDERARSAEGRLTIAFSAPDRWVLRYEAHGQVAWISDRIRRPGALRSRLAELSQDVVQRVHQSGPVERRRQWNDDLILALQNEIVDPFEDEPRTERRPISILWSEVVDPFADRPPRANVTQVWSEVLDPWAVRGGSR